jgi:predicted MFS family arabinose efflux permease
VDTSRSVDHPRAGTDPAVGRAVRAVFVAYIANGFAFATWVSRIPQLKSRLDLSPGDLGLVLLSLSVGSVLALPTSGLVVNRLGTRRAVMVMAGVLGVGLTIVAVGVNYGPVPVSIGLLTMGLGTGNWDVAMNVEAAAVEQRLGRSIMSRFHAGFSVGTVAAALIGAALVALHVSVTVHFAVVAVATAISVPCAARGFLGTDAQSTGPDAGGARAQLTAWTERRTVLIGLFVLTAAFAEGTGNDWLGVATVDGYHVSAAAGSLTYAVFVTAMTVGRWFGPNVINRWGRVLALRACVALGVVGVIITVFGQHLPIAVVGVVAWGLGTAIGFPVGMSAAADDPRYAAARVSVVASVGYTAFLAGPPLIGFLGDHVGVLHSISVAAALLAVGFLLAGACRPLPAQPDQRAKTT